MTDAALTAAIIRELRLGVSRNRLRIIAATLGLSRDTGTSEGGDA